MSPAGTDIALVEEAFERAYCVGAVELGPDIMCLRPSMERGHLLPHLLGGLGSARRCVGPERDSRQEDGGDEAG